MQISNPPDEPTALVSAKTLCVSVWLFGVCVWVLFVCVCLRVRGLCVYFFDVCVGSSVFACATHVRGHTRYVSRLMCVRVCV